MSRPFRKGDWVVFPSFPKWPMRLERDEQSGWMSFLLSGGLFMASDDSFEAGCERMTAVQCPEEVGTFGESRSWHDVNCVRRARASDFTAVVRGLASQGAQIERDVESWLAKLEEFKQKK